MIPDLARKDQFPAALPPLRIVLAGLLATAMVTAAALYVNGGLYIAAALLGVLLLYVILRHPTAIAYIALIWLVFEKGVGGHFGSLANTISTAGDGLLVVALISTIVVNLMRNRHPILAFGPIGPALVGFIGLGIVSTIVNGVPLHIAGLGILSTVHSMIIFLVIISIGITAKDVHTFVYWTIGVMAVAALIGILQVFPQSPAWALGGLRMHAIGGLMRVDGPLEHPLSLGDDLAMTAPLAFMLLLFGRLDRQKRDWLVLASGLMVVAILLTFAREAWIALAIGALFLGLTVERRLLKIFVVYVLPAIVLLALLTVPFLGSFNSVDTGAQRLTFFRLALPLIKSHLLFGAGPGRFGGHVALVTHTPLYAQYHLTGFFYGTGNQIDQFWTHLLAESGILGTLVYLSGIVACFLVGRRAYGSAVTPRRRAIILGLMYAIPVTVLISVTSSTLEAGPGATLFWGLMGMLIVLAMQGEPDSRSAGVVDA